MAANLGLARVLARRFVNRGEPYDDLLQVASIALIKSVDRFDPDRGVEFVTFATTTVLGELKRHFRDKGWAVRAPRRLQELYLELGQAVSSLSQELGRSPTVAELAPLVGVSEEAVLEAMEAGQGYRSSSIDASNDEQEPLSARLGSNDAKFVGIEDRGSARPGVVDLARPRTGDPGLALFRGADPVGDRCQGWLAQMHVSRLLTASLKRLRATFVLDS